MSFKDSGDFEIISLHGRRIFEELPRLRQGGSPRRALFPHPVFGDRRQEIVFIGTGMDEAAIRAKFDAYLIDDDDFEQALLPGDDFDDRFDPAPYASLPDPFPAWGPQT